MKSENDLFFSSEVAETLGMECALILSQYNLEKFGNINSFEELKISVKKNFSFLDEKKIEESIKTLIKFELLVINKNINDKSYNLKTPSKNTESSQLNNKWIPSLEVNEILKFTDITEEFYQLKLKEFKVYWIERGQKKNNWNSTFIDFIRREWAKEINSIKTLPYTIDERWYPDDDVFDILNLSEITKDSALKYLKEFILYWKDKGSAFTTWNSKFIEHVKRRQMIKNEISNNEENKKHSEPGKYSQDFKTRKNDNSWAKEISLD